MIKFLLLLLSMFVLSNGMVGAYSGEINVGSDVIQYTHVAQYAKYNEDCTGLWCVAYFRSNRNTPVFMLGGHDIVDTKFSFLAMEDGTITMSREAEVVGLPQSWTVYYAETRLGLPTAATMHI